MAAFWAPENYAALSADGSAAGYITVTDNSKFYVGAEVFLTNDDLTGQRAIIVTIGASGKIYLRFLKEGLAQVPTYGYGSCSAYTTAKNSSVFMPAQCVRLNGIGSQTVPASL